MMIRAVLIAGGNATALVRDCPTALRASLAGDLLREVEQVGFVDDQARPPRLEMMGGEFCINATLAFASTLGPEGTLKVSGLDSPVDFANGVHSSRATIPLRWSMTENIVLLEGIGFILTPKPDGQAPNSSTGSSPGSPPDSPPDNLTGNPTDHARTKRELADLCTRFNLPAFGAIHFSGNAITPYVYVPAVNSFVPETACGSGSVAFSLFTGQDQVRQPSGRFITVRRTAVKDRKGRGVDLFEIEARVEQDVLLLNSGQGVALCPGCD